MVKLILVPSDEYFEENVLQLYRRTKASLIVVIVDGCAVACDDVRILPNGWLGYSSRNELGELRVSLDRVKRITYYLYYSWV